jgi:hypothetical protein
MCACGKEGKVHLWHQWFCVECLKRILEDGK